jgi:hypothetical protein
MGAMHPPPGVKLSMLVVGRVRRRTVGRKAVRQNNGEAGEHREAKEQLRRRNSWRKMVRWNNYVPEEVIS